MWIPTQNLTGHLSGLATNRELEVRAIKLLFRHD
jgi:hypothetical protein